MADAQDICIDLNRLSYGQYQAFVSGDTAGDLIPLLATVVTTWPHPGDPSDPASYADLGMLDMLALAEALRAAIQQATADLGN